MTNSPRVLVACEYSGIVRDAMTNAGADAISCDLLPSESPGPHHQGDVEKFFSENQFDLVIAHPPCTALCVSGNRHYAKGTPGYGQRHAAIDWTLEFWELMTSRCDHVAMENPASVIFPRLRQRGVAISYVQPWQHGHGETKLTGFALHGLAPLAPSDIASGRADRVHKMTPSPDRWKDRSRTYTGIATAMANQWLKGIQ